MFLRLTVRIDFIYHESPAGNPQFFFIFFDTTFLINFVTRTLDFLIDFQIFNFNPKVPIWLSVFCKITKSLSFKILFLFLLVV